MFGEATPDWKPERMAQGRVVRLGIQDSKVDSLCLRVKRSVLVLIHRHRTMEREEDISEGIGT